MILSAPFVGALIAYWRSGKGAWHRYPEKSAAEHRTVVSRPHQQITKRRWPLALGSVVAWRLPVRVVEAELSLPIGDLA